MDQNVIAFRPPPRRARTAVADPRMLGALGLVAIEALFFLGLMATFQLTRETAGVAWPPAGQPWFPLGETALNSVALLASGALVARAAHTWEDRDARIAPVLFAAILLGGFFLFFQGVVWLRLLGEGLGLTASAHGRFFCLIVALHAAHTLGALALLGVVWLRLGPFRDDGAPRRKPLRESGFSAVRVAWYFAVAAWPVLYVSLYS